MSIDDLVDELLAKQKNIEPDKDKPSNESFRYLTDKEEIKQELNIDKPNIVSVMKSSDEKSIFELYTDMFPVAMGDINTIESIIDKHKKNITEKLNQ